MIVGIVSVGSGMAGAALACDGAGFAAGFGWAGCDGIAAVGVTTGL